MKLGWVLVGSATVVVVAAAGGVAAAAPVAGTVITGHVTDTGGHALRGAEIRFAQFPEPASTPAGVTAADGSFRVVLAVGSAPSSVVVEGAPATGPTSDAGYGDTVLVHPRDSSPVVVTPHAGAHLDAGRLQVVPAAGESGRVTSSDGHPLARIVVTTDVEFGDSVHRAVTDANGRWTIRGIDVGNPGTTEQAWVGFDAAEATGGTSPTGYPDTCLGQTPTPCERGGSYEGPPTQTVTLTPGVRTGGVTIALQPAAELAGRLTDDRGRGIGGVGVSAGGAVRDADTGVSVSGGDAISDTSGGWRITRLFPETVALCFGFGQRIVGIGLPAADGYVPQCWKKFDQTGGRTPITLLPGRARTGLDATLAGAGAVHGTVVDAHGDPIPSATLRVGEDDDDGGVVVRAPVGTSNARGSYRVAGVYTGDTTVCASAPGFATNCPFLADEGVPVTVSEYGTATAPTIVLQAART